MLLVCGWAPKHSKIKAKICEFLKLGVPRWFDAQLQTSRVWFPWGTSATPPDFIYSGNYRCFRHLYLVETNKKLFSYLLTLHKNNVFPKSRLEETFESISYHHEKWLARQILAYKCKSLTRKFLLWTWWFKPRSRKVSYTTILIA